MYYLPLAAPIGGRYDTGSPSTIGYAEHMLSRSLNAASLIALCGLSVICFVNFKGALPSTGLDPSWQYVAAYAAHSKMVFGQDFVFTNGPLAPLYTHFYFPVDQSYYVFFSIAIVIGFCFTIWRASNVRGRPFFILIPFVIANITLPDAFYIISPLTLVFLVRLAPQDDKMSLLTQVLFVTLLGLWPLIKGTFAIPAAVSILTASLIAALRGQSRFIALLILPLISITACWYLIGQPLMGLPQYLRQVFTVASGYTDAMSLSEHPLQPVLFILAASFMFLAASLPPNKQGLLEQIAIAAVLFIAFKASFVREHLIIAGTSLVFISLVLIIIHPTKSRLLASICCLVTGLHLCSYEENVAPTTALKTFSNTFTQSTWNMVRWASANQVFRAEFDAAANAISETAHLPPSLGTVDIYSYDQALLLASGQHYSPRPVPQSYSAYTPELAALNQKHLEGSAAPDSIIFAPQPIDGRYPSLEDGASWPDLLSRYYMDSYYDEYVLLKKRLKPESYTISRPTVLQKASLDQTIDVRDFTLAWTSIHLSLSRLGQLARIFWKNPPLTIHISYTDGREASFRLIAGMAQSGFLLSPTVATATEFASLRTLVRGTLDRRVKSFSITQDSRFPFWNRTYDLEISELRVPPLSDADKAGRSTEQQAIKGVPRGGSCSIDMIGEKLATGVHPTISVTQQSVTITGWATSGDPHSDSLGKLRIAIQSDDATDARFYDDIRRFRRPDVDAAFSLEHHLDTGFSAHLNLAPMQGLAALYLIQKIDGRDIVCPTKARIDVQSAKP